MKKDESFITWLAAALSLAIILYAIYAAVTIKL